MYFSKLILKDKNNIKITWHVIKEAIQKEKHKQQNLAIQKSIIQTDSIAESFNRYFTQIGPNLAKDIGTSTKSFDGYIKKHDTTQLEEIISVNELKDALFSLKINKRAGHHGISFNVVKILLWNLTQTSVAHISSFFTNWYFPR